MKRWICAVLSVLGFYCSGAYGQKLSKDILAQAEAFVYKHNTGSLPPPHQRTWVYDVSRDSVVVIEYAEANKTRTAYAITPERFEQFKQEIDKCCVASKKHKVRHPGTGGTSHWFSVYGAGNKHLFGVNGYKCGGEIEGTLNYKENPHNVFNKIIRECRQTKAAK